MASPAEADRVFGSSSGTDNGTTQGDSAAERSAVCFYNTGVGVAGGRNEEAEIMTNEYAGVCRICFCPIKHGQEMRYRDEGLLFHTVCTEQYPNSYYARRERKKAEKTPPSDGNRKGGKECITN